MKKSLLAGALILALAFAVFFLGRQGGGKEPELSAQPGPTAQALAKTGAAIKKACTKCHAFPPPDCLPKSAWPPTILNMYKFVGLTGKRLEGFAAEETIAWYVAHAPEHLALIPGSEDEGGPVTFRKRELSPPGAPPTPAVSNVTLIKSGQGRQDILVCDMRHGLVLRGYPAQPKRKMRLLGRVPHPCKSEPCDLDRDGRGDLLIADLGSLPPDDHHKGQVILMRGTGGGFANIVLAKGLGRVADARPADFDGDGDLDVVVAVFGWRDTGQLLWLENRTKSWAAPDFIPHQIDKRHGAIHAQVTDLDGDGRLDFVTIYGQEIESVEAFFNRADGDTLRFERKLLYQAPHPGWGSTGIDLADIDGDGDQDILVSNGDTLDDYVVKPYHGLRWLENRGKEGWKPHPLLTLYGVNRAVAADLDGDGDQDIVAAAFLPHLDPGGDLAKLRIASLIWLEQEAPGRFRAHVIERNHAFHPSLSVGDFDADGDVDIVTGCFTMGRSAWAQQPAWVEVWENTSR